MDALLHWLEDAPFSGNIRELQDVFWILVKQYVQNGTQWDDMTELQYDKFFRYCCDHDPRVRDDIMMIFQVIPRPLLTEFVERCEVYNSRYKKYFQAMFFEYNAKKRLENPVMSMKYSLIKYHFLPPYYHLDDISAWDKLFSLTKNVPRIFRVHPYSIFVPEVIIERYYDRFINYFFDIRKALTKTIFFHTLRSGRWNDFVRIMSDPVIGPDSCNLFVQTLNNDKYTDFYVSKMPISIAVYQCVISFIIWQIQHAQLKNDAVVHLISRTFAVIFGWDRNEILRLMHYWIRDETVSPEVYAKIDVICQVQYYCFSIKFSNEANLMTYALMVCDGTLAIKDEMVVKPSHRFFKICQQLDMKLPLLQMVVDKVYRPYILGTNICVPVDIIRVIAEIGKKNPSIFMAN